MASAATWSTSPNAEASDGATVHGYFLAGWLPRVGATLLDAIIMLPIWLVAASAFHLVTVTHELTAQGNSVPRLHEHHAWVFPIIYLIYLVGLVCRSGEHNGQTLGKQAFGIRVVRNDGKPVGLQTGLLREGAIKLLPSLIAPILGLFNLVDDLWPLGDSQNRALHDHIVKTHVVQTRREPNAYELSGQAPVWPGAVPVAAGVPAGASAMQAPPGATVAAAGAAAFAPPGAAAPTTVPPGTATAAPAAAAPGLTAGAGAYSAPAPPPPAPGPMLRADGVAMVLGEVAVGHTVFVGIEQLAKDTGGRAWVHSTAPVWTAQDAAHGARVSAGPDGLYVSIPAAYDARLPSSAADPASYERIGWRPAVLTLS